MPDVVPHPGQDEDSVLFGVLSGSHSDETARTSLSLLLRETPQTVLYLHPFSRLASLLFMHLSLLDDSGEGVQEDPDQ